MKIALYKKIVASALALTMLTSSVYAMPSDSGKSVSYRELVGSTSGKSDSIKDEMKNFKVLVDSGAMQPHDAVTVLAKNLVDKGVGFADIDAYVKERTTRTEYKAFKTSFESAMSGINAQNMTSAELTQAMAQSLSSQNVEGLSWSGCGGMATGIVLLVAAVVVGVVAIVKSQGSARITASYESQKTTRTSQYNSDYANMQNEPQIIQSQMQTNTNTISSNNVQIAVLTGEIATASSSDPNYSANIQTWAGQIQSITVDNQNLANSNTSLNLQLAQWNDPTYMQTQLDTLTYNYHSDETTITTEESSAISLVPANQALAKGLGIGAGIGAAIGLYLVIDGAHDGGC